MDKHRQIGEPVSWFYEPFYHTAIYKGTHKGIRYGFTGRSKPSWKVGMHGCEGEHLRPISTHKWFK